MSTYGLCSLSMLLVSSLNAKTFTEVLLDSSAAVWKELAGLFETGGFTTLFSPNIPFDVILREGEIQSLHGISAYCIL